MSKVTDEMLAVFKDCNARIGYDLNQRTRDGLQALFDANLISLPVDAEKVREDAVREAMALFDDKNAGWNGAGVQKRLQSLLPTKDRAEELAKEYWDSPGTRPVECMSEDQLIADAFRWLIEREGVKP